MTGIPPEFLSEASAVNTLLQQGLFDQALARAQQLSRNVSCAQTDYLLGLAHMLSGNEEAALPLLTRATEREPDNHRYHNNLGEAHRRHGNFELACAQFRQALALEPNYANARYNLGCSLFEQGNYSKARTAFKQAIALERDNSRFHSALADALRELGKYRLAEAAYRKAIQLDSKAARAHANLGLMLLRLGQLDEALQCCETAVELSPHDPVSYQNLGRSLVELERLDDAMEAYAKAHDIAPESVDLAICIGRVWLEVGEMAEAEFWFAKALSLDENSTEARCGLASLAREAEDTESAIEQLSMLRDENPESLEVRLELAKAFWDDGDTEAAANEAGTAAKLFPELAAIHSTKGSILASAGKVEEAIEAHGNALQQNPFCIPALTGLANIQRGKLDNDLVKRIEKLLSRRGLREGARASLHSGLATYHDSRAEVEGALYHSRQANSLQWAHKTRRGWDYEASDFQTYIDDVTKCFTPELFQRLEGSGLTSTTPVFIVGMPRSGTTLTEQILARHRKVLGIGERTFANRSLLRAQHAYGGNRPLSEWVPELEPGQLQEIAESYLQWLQQAADKSGKPGVIHIIDKMPDNYSMLGWLHLLFPRAKFIHTRRDIRDVALSCWMTQFRSIQWACDMQHIAARIRQYQRIMEHWKRVLPVEVFESDYEELVSNQETHSRHLLQWLGLEWDTRCLEFYKADAPVRTASVTQVREAIYHRSVGRWKPYSDLLSPVTALIDKARKEPG